MTSIELINSVLDSSRSSCMLLYLYFKSIVLAKTSSSFLDKSLTSPISFRYILIGSSYVSLYSFFPLDKIFIKSSFWEYVSTDGDPDKSSSSSKLEEVEIKTLSIPAFSSTLSMYKLSFSLVSSFKLLRSFLNLLYFLLFLQLHPLMM